MAQCAVHAPSLEAPRTPRHPPPQRRPVPDGHKNINTSRPELSITSTKQLCVAATTRAIKSNCLCCTIRALDELDQAVITVIQKRHCSNMELHRGNRTILPKFFQRASQKKKTKSETEGDPKCCIPCHVMTSSNASTVSSGGLQGIAYHVSWKLGFTTPHTALWALKKTTDGATSSPCQQNRTPSCLATLNMTPIRSPLRSHESSVVFILHIVQQFVLNPLPSIVGDK